MWDPIEDIRSGDPKGAAMYERIVVGTDGSERANDAVRAAGEMARLCGVGEVHVVSASHPLSASELARIRNEIPDEFHDLVDPLLHANDHIRDADLALGPGVKAIGHPAIGDPAGSILSVATELDADLIVVGARGLSAIGRFLRGSVSTKVAHHSTSDVLVVEHEHDQTESPEVLHTGG
ncbi:MAG: universal stress protein [Actinomycetota bacterium]